MALSDSGRRAKKLEVARRLAAIAAQDIKVKKMRADQRKFTKNQREHGRSLTPAREIEFNNIVKSKKDAIFNENQRLLKLKADLKAYRAQMK